MDRVRDTRYRKAVPQAKKTFRQSRNEIADENGIKISRYGQKLGINSMKSGYLGDYIVKKLIMLSEEQLIGRR